MAYASKRRAYREAMQKALRKHFKEAGLEIDFEAGVIEGPQDARDIGCVWFEGKRPFARDGNQEETFLHVRVLRRFLQDQGGGEPRGLMNEQLEETWEILEDALYANIKRVDLEANAGLDAGDLQGFASYFNVVDIALFHPGQYVEATLNVQARNRTHRGD